MIDYAMKRVFRKQEAAIPLEARRLSGLMDPDALTVSPNFSEYDIEGRFSNVHLVILSCLLMRIDLMNTGNRIQSDVVFCSKDQTANEQIYTTCTSLRDWETDHKNAPPFSQMYRTEWTTGFSGRKPFRYDEDTIPVNLCLHAPGANSVFLENTGKGAIWLLYT